VPPTTTTCSWQLPVPDTAQEALIAQYCHELRTPALCREYPALVRQATDAGWGYQHFLVQLLDVEVEARRQSAAARCLREARLPEVKTLDQLDWNALQGIQPGQVAELATCAYLDRGDDVVIAGPIGTGKTHVAIALAVEAARRRYRVAFVRAADLVRSLIEARDERTLTRLHQRYERVALLVVDELGFVPFDRAGSELLFNLLADRYEQRSTLITTNLSFSEWVQVFGDEKLTTALLDRLGHHGHILTTRGQSFRTRRRPDSPHP
jgi:DNA replication protein DnaC